MDPRLHDALVASDLEQVKQLIQEGIDPSLPDNDGNTVFHLVCASSECGLTMLQYLTDVVHGSVDASRATADTIAIRNGRGQTALHVACQAGNADIVRFLGQYHSAACIEGLGPSLIRTASEAGNESVVQVFVDKDWLDWFPIEEVLQSINILIDKGLTSVAVRLLGALTLEQARQFFTCSGELIGNHDVMYSCVVAAYQEKLFGLMELLLNSFTFEQFFSRAVRKGDVELAHFIIEGGIKSVLVPLSSSALHEACKGGYTDIAIFLAVQLNVCVNTRDASGCTPLHKASSEGHLEVVQFLTSHKDCQVNCHGSDNRTPLIMASQGGRNSYLEVVEYLISIVSCNANAQDENGNTALHYSSKRGDCCLAKYLTKHCHRDIVNNKRETALHVAGQCGHLDVVQHLVSQGYNANAQDEDGNTPLHLSASESNILVMNFLKVRTDLAITNNQGEDFYQFMQRATGHMDSVSAVINTSGIVNHSEQSVDRMYNEKASSEQRRSLPMMNPCLHNTLLANDLEKVKQLIQDGIDPSLLDNDGNTVFHLVCASSECGLTMLQYLTDVYRSADASLVNTLRNSHGSTPLHLTCITGKADYVQYLSRCPNFANAVSSRDDQANTPLYYAISGGHETIVNLLTNKKSNWLINLKESDAHNCVSVAIEHEDTGIVELLWNSGNLNVMKELIIVAGCSLRRNGKSFLDYKCIKEISSCLNQFVCETYFNTNCTPLHVASFNGPLDLVQHLIHVAGCNVNFRDELGDTALHWACRGSQVEIVKYLTSLEPCDCDVKGFKDCTPLHEALKVGPLELVQHLISVTGCNVNAQDIDGDTALHFACRGSQVEIVKYLTSLGQCDCEAKGFNQRTPLLDASEMGPLVLIQHLISVSGCNVNAQDIYAFTALHFACRRRNIEIVKYLTSLSQCDYEIKNFIGFTPLLVASEVGSLQIVQHLVSVAGCNVNAKDLNNYTALQISLNKNYMDIVKFLFFNKDCDCAVKNSLGSALLHKAALSDDLEIVQCLVDSGSGCDVNAQDNNGNTALHIAITNNSMKVLKFLISIKECIYEKKNSQGRTLLHIASMCGHLEIVQYLVRSGFDVNAQDEDGNTALRMAFNFDHTDVALFLISCKEWDCKLHSLNIMKTTLLHEATTNDNLEIVQSLVNRGCDVNAQDISGKTALQIAITKNSVEIIKCLISSEKWKYEEKNSSQGRNLLHGFSERGHLELVQCLVDSGYKVNAQDNNGDTALHIAFSKRHMEIVKYLIAHKECDCNVKNHQKRTLLHQASQEGCLEVIQRLVDTCDNINEQDMKGFTALQIAFNKSNMDIVKLLISCKKCDCEVKYSRNRTLIHKASQAGHLEIVQHLVDRGCNVNAQDMGGNTALHVVCSNGQFEVMKYLTSLTHCQSEMKDNFGNTPLHLASERDYLHIVQHLVSVVGCSTSAGNKLGKTPLQIAIDCGRKKIMNYLRSFPEDTNTNKDKSNSEEAVYLKHYRMAAQNTRIVRVKPVKCLMTGPPGAGKTTTKRRLLDEPLPVFSASTGVVDAPLPVAIISSSPKPLCVRSVNQQGAVVPDLKKQSVCWKKQDLDEELLSFLHPASETPVLDQSTENIKRDNSPEYVQSQIKTIPEQNPVLNKCYGVSLTIENSTLPQATDTPSVKEWSGISIALDQPTTSVSSSSPQSTSVTEHDDDPPSSSELTNDSVSTDWLTSREVLRMVDAIPEDKQKTCFESKDGNPMHDASLHIIDTGGQPEFHEILPIFITGPAINLLVFKLTEDLHKRYTIEYRLESGNSEPYKTSLTHEEMMLRSLASIACLRHNTIGWQVDNTTLEDNSEPAAFLIGTHRDQVNEEKVSAVNEHLKMRIESSTELFEDLVQYSSEEQVVFALDNLHDTEEINKLRGALNRTILEKFKVIDVPLSWHVFSVNLRKSNIPIFTVKSCSILATESGISVDNGELEAALWFLHHRVGVLMHYPKVEGIEDLIIVDLQVLFDRVTDLITNSFTFTKTGSASSVKKFKDWGLFTDYDVKKISSSKSDLLIPKRLIPLLKYLHIIAIETYYQGNRKMVRYFMPCALRPANIEGEEEKGDEECSSLLVCFKCGYVPVGVFCCLVVYLLNSSQSKDCPFKWKRANTPQYRNKMTFLAGRCLDTVTLLCQASYLEVKLAKREQRMSVSFPTHQLASIVCNDLHKAIEAVSKTLNYTNKSQHQFGFHCSCESGQPHPLPAHTAVCEGDSPVVMECVAGGGVSSLNDKQLVWYGKEMKTSELSPSSVFQSQHQHKAHNVQFPQTSTQQSQTTTQNSTSYPPPGPHSQRSEQASLYQTQGSSSAPYPSRLTSGPLTSESSDYQRLVQTPPSSQQSYGEQQISKPSQQELLGIADLKIVLEIITDINDWQRLGLGLDILFPTLERIRIENRESIFNCKMQMMAEWLQQPPNLEGNGGPSWKQLAQALRSIDQVSTAQHIEKNFCKHI